MSRNAREGVGIELAGDPLMMAGRKGEKIMNTKPDYRWSFRSSAEDFDGDRILREAKETGATLIRVERCGDVIWFVRRDFARRARRERA